MQRVENSYTPLHLIKGLQFHKWEMHSVYIRVELVWLCDEEARIIVEFAQKNLLHES